MIVNLINPVLDRLLMVYKSSDIDEMAAQCSVAQDGGGSFF